MTGNKQTPHQHPKYRPDIDGLRAIAVLSVVAFHAFPEWIPGGFIGVDIFFVISGFLISTIIFENLERATFSFADFYSRRIRRIFPALILVLSASILFGWFMLTPLEYDKLGQHVVGGAGFFSNFILWKESGYFDSAANLKPLLHLWSLGIEEQFYIFWPLLVWFIWRWKNKLWMLIGFLIVSSMAINIALVSSNPVADFYSPFSRFWELLIGATIAYLQIYKKDLEKIFQKFANIFSISGLILIFLSLGILDGGARFPGWLALLPTLGAALIIFSGKEGWVNHRILSHPVLVWVGLISFPLYLWHWPLLSLSRMIQGKFPTGLMALYLVIISIALAWLTFIFLERKIRFGRRDKFYTLLLVLMMLLIGVAGYVIKTLDGIESRFSIKPLEIHSGEFDCHNQDNGKPPCVFGNLASDRLIVIYGDSHAGHLTNALNQALGKDYKLMFFGENCYLTKRENNRPECRIRLEEMRRLSSEKIYAVIRSQRWEKHTLFDESSIKSGVIEASETYGLSPEKIIIVGSTEEIASDCEFAGYYIPLRRFKCPINKASESYNKLFMSVTRGMSLPENVYFVYPYDKLCPNDVCEPIRGTVSNYDDNHHLTQDGAMLVMPDIAQILNK
jgi:peptidoglycan/LPS O-acetylase OafA/YrhL